MKHIRSLEIEQPLDALLDKRAADGAFLQEERDAGPRFFRGLMIGAALSLSFYAVLFIAVF